MTTCSPGFLSLRKWAARAPVMPLPTMTRSAERGRWVVVRWPNSFSDGSRCQYDAVGFSTGRPDCP